MDTYQKIIFTLDVTVYIYHRYKDAADTQKKYYITLLARNFIVQVGCFELYSFHNSSVQLWGGLPHAIKDLRKSLILQLH